MESLGRREKEGYAFNLIKSSSSFTARLLVLIVEHYLPQNYFNKGLIAAQADQIILRDLVTKYCPRIANAMRELEVDISTITLNWFIAVFVNSVPMEVSFPLHSIKRSKSRKFISMPFF